MMGSFELNNCDYQISFLCLVHEGCISWKIRSLKGNFVCSPFLLLSFWALVYSKPTDSHLYLQAGSSHQKSSVIGIQKGVALRLRRICSTEEDFECKVKEYKAYLVARDHDPFFVCKAFETTKLMPRKKAREKVNKRKRVCGCVCMCVCVCVCVCLYRMVCVHLEFYLLYDGFL